MKHRQIVNIINFIRAVERYPGTDQDKRDAVRGQIELLDRLGLKATFLVLYDVFEDADYMRMLRGLDPARYEIGVWFEIEQYLCEASGLPWRGKTQWEQWCDTGYPMGYSIEDRKTIIDTFFGRFKAEFGYYPRVFGTWFSDSFTLRYICDTYGLDAACNCKEQYGTDGYTLWGGYYGQGYYPSRQNIFHPAQTAQRQLDVPMFRMLGSDPIYQYDISLDINSDSRSAQYVITLEPAYDFAGGGNRNWVDWYFKENYNDECLSFGYAQAGQENCFGWKQMRNGLTYQFETLAQMQRRGEVEIERLGETGRWYKSQYARTPASAIAAHGAFDDAAKSSVWYCSRFYRANLYQEDGRLWIRDIHLFDEQMEDPFEHAVCTEKSAAYLTLPVADGFVHSGNGVRAGLYFFDAESGAPLRGESMTYREVDADACDVQTAPDGVRFRFSARGICAERDRDFTARYLFGRKTEHFPAPLFRDAKTLRLAYASRTYEIRLSAGRFTDDASLVSENGKLCAAFHVVD